MKITASAVVLNVDDVAASSTFLADVFGFRQEMAADGFVLPLAILTALKLTIGAAIIAGLWHLIH